MRKSVIGADGERTAEAAGWLDVERLATVEITSEDERFPIEDALRGVKMGWRAGATGPQVVRLRFDEPVEVHRVELHVVERAAERTQEMALSVEMAGMGVQEVRRQQFTFAPGGSTEEREDFTMELKGVTMLEVRIDPDRSHDPKMSQHYASLMLLRVG